MVTLAATYPMGTMPVPGLMPLRPGPVAPGLPAMPAPMPAPVLGGAAMPTLYPGALSTPAPMPGPMGLPGAASGLLAGGLSGASPTGGGLTAGAAPSGVVSPALPDGGGAGMGASGGALGGLTGLLGNPMMQGLAQGLAWAGAPSLMPRTLGQGLAMGMAQGNLLQQQALQSEMQRERLKLAREEAETARAERERLAGGRETAADVLEQLRAGDITREEAGYALSAAPGYETMGGQFLTRAMQGERMEQELSLSERRLGITEEQLAETRRANQAREAAAARTNELARLKLERELADSGRWETTNIQNARSNFMREIDAPREALGAYERMVNLAPGGDVANVDQMTGQDDVALVFSYMKALDPGSVVRSDEAATVRNAAGVPEAARGMWNRVFKGDTLTPAQRRDVFETARKAVERRVGEARQTIDYYTGLAQRGGANPEDVITWRPTEALLTAVTTTPAQRAAASADDYARRAGL